MVTPPKKIMQRVLVRCLVPLLSLHINAGVGDSPFVCPRCSTKKTLIPVFICADIMFGDGTRNSSIFLYN